MPTLELFKLWGKSPKEAAMTRSKFSIKAALLAGGIGLSMAGFAGSQPAAAQSYSDAYPCSDGTIYDPTYGSCIVPDYAYDYGYLPDNGYGYLPYGGYGYHEFGHGFGHGMGGSFNRGVGFAHAGGFGGFHRGGGGGHR
jgi:hypothetical protein